VIAGGLLVAFVGYSLLKAGKDVVTHWTGQPLYSVGLIVAGILLVVLSMIPSSWVSKAAAIDRHSGRPQEKKEKHVTH
jgi:hypothetical protein